MKPFQNDKFSTDCEASQPDTGDQSRKYMSQAIARQNTFNDQTGMFYPVFQLCNQSRGHPRC